MQIWSKAQILSTNFLGDAWKSVWRICKWILGPGGGGEYSGEYSGFQVTSHNILLTSRGETGKKTSSQVPFWGLSFCPVQPSVDSARLTEKDLLAVKYLV